MSARRHPSKNRRGMVLVIVLIVVAFLSLAAYTFSDLMLTQNEAARLRGKRIQTQALVESGVASTRYFLMQDETTRDEAGGVYDNPTYFQNVLVLDSDDPLMRASFTVLSPNLDQQGYLAGVRYGLEDESAKLNLNALALADKVQPDGGRTLLLALPGMTEETADAILDWMDADDEPRELGAEIEYYATLEPPYRPKNAPLQSIEELLLVRGVTPQLLFGVDVNRNGVVDDYEASGQVYGADEVAVQMVSEIQSFGGELDRGWSAYLTLFSKERNVNSLGEPRIDLNLEDLQQLYDDLLAALQDESWAAFIVAYRQSAGEYEGTTQPRDYAGEQLDLTQPARTEITQVLDLVGKNIEVRFAGQNQAVVLRSPFANDLAATMLYLPTLMDAVSVNPSPTIPGRLNISQCPATLLYGIPGLQEDQVTAILDYRTVEQSDDSLLANQMHETWLLTAGIVDLDQMKTLMPLVCAGGDVYRCQIVGYYEGGGASSRAEVVFDATAASPRILSWKDISHLGRGYPLEVLGMHFTEMMPP